MPRHKSESVFERRAGRGRSQTLGRSGREYRARLLAGTRARGRGDALAELDRLEFGGAESPWSARPAVLQVLRVWRSELGLSHFRLREGCARDRRALRLSAERGGCGSAAVS